MDLKTVFLSAVICIVLTSVTAQSPSAAPTTTPAPPTTTTPPPTAVPPTATPPPVAAFSPPPAATPPPVATPPSVATPPPVAAPTAAVPVAAPTPSTMSPPAPPTEAPGPAVTSNGLSPAPSTTTDDVSGVAKMGSMVGSMGLRQGDPLFPFLFILAIEALNVVLEEAKAFFSGHGSGDRIHISHLQFADDAIIMGDWLQINVRTCLEFLLATPPSVATPPPVAAPTAAVPVAAPTPSTMSPPAPPTEAPGPAVTSNGLSPAPSTTTDDVSGVAKMGSMVGSMVVVIYMNKKEDLLGFPAKNRVFRRRLQCLTARQSFKFMVGQGLVEVVVYGGG
nr:classical arabinogalactan protein 9-like [Tanacetum cinerariifolium]